MPSQQFFPQAPPLDKMHATACFPVAHEMEDLIGPQSPPSINIINRRECLFFIRGVLSNSCCMSRYPFAVTRCGTSDSIPRINYAVHVVAERSITHTTVVTQCHTE